ncbi:MAG: glutamate mutase L [Propionibacteriaceae bacterium]
MTWICADFGSTWTKVAAIEPGVGLIATVASPTTTATDVLEGWQDCLRQLASYGIDAGNARVRACSSAGGGLRIAVVGNEALVTGEAGRRVSLSSGGHVVAVQSGGVDIAALVAAKPDLILLLGGTDNGNSAPLLAAAKILGEAKLGLPLVVAGDAYVAEEVSFLLQDQPHTVAANVVPEIGVFRPLAAREQVREMFLKHVIGGKGLSRSNDFAQMVRGATPDVVLRGADVVSQLAGDVVIVDVGGATTDVHSVVEVEYPEPREDEEGELLSADVVGYDPAMRSVEGDLGMRWSAATTLAAGHSEGLLSDDKNYDQWVAGLVADTLPQTSEQKALDAQLCRAAIATALRRHAGFTEVMFINGQRIVRQTGTDIREAKLVIGSGGVLRADPVAGKELLSEALIAARTPGRMLPGGGGWQPKLAIDGHYLLAPIGLLAQEDPDTALLLTRTLLSSAG